MNQQQPVPRRTLWLLRLFSRVDALIVILVLLAAAPAALMLYFVTQYWLPLPYWDEWATPGGLFVSWSKGTLTLQELFSQHNESRKFFPRLLYLALASIGGWDVRQEIALCFASVCVIGGLFYKLIRQTPGASAVSALVAWIAGMFLCFSAVQFENFLWGIQLEPFFPGLAVLGIALVNTSQRSVSRKALLSALLAFVATYTFANGMLLWLLGTPIRSRDDASSRWRLILVYTAYCLAAAISVGAYFIGYQRPGNHPELLPGNAGIAALFHYLVLWIGSYFASPIVPPFAAGLTAAILFLIAVLSAFGLMIRTRNWRPFYPALLIGAYACITAGTIAVGRIGFGVEQALDARYRTFSLFFYLATVALIFALYCSCIRSVKSAPRALFLGACAALALTAFSAWIGCYVDRVRHQEILYTRNLTLLRALQWIDVIPDNPDLLLIYPILDQLIDRSRILRENKLFRLPYPSPNAVAKVQRPPFDIEGETVGRLQTCMFDTNHNLYITGSAKLPLRKHYADTVVIGCVDASGSFKPFSVMHTNLPPPKDGKRSKTPRVNFGRAFNPANVPPGDITIAAWAIDMRGGEAYPLGGATQFTADQR